MAINIYVDDLTAALRSFWASTNQSHYLNTTTGDVAIAADGDLVEGDMDWAQPVAEALATGQYLEIKPVPNKCAQGIMADYMQTMPDIPLRERLRVALDSPNPIGSFLDNVRCSQEYDSRWLKFEERAYRKLAIDWLKANDIDAVLTDSEPLR